MRRDSIKNSFASAKVVEILSTKAILIFLFGFSFDQTVSKMSEVQNVDLSKLSDAEARDLLKKLSEKLDTLEIREKSVSTKHGLERLILLSKTISCDKAFIILIIRKSDLI